DAARDAVRAAWRAGALPLTVSSSGVSWDGSGVGKPALAPKRVLAVADAAVAIAKALPDVAVSAPSNAPLVGAGGRRLIRPVKRDSLPHKIFTALEMWPMAILITLSGAFSWLWNDTHYVSLHVWVVPLAFVVLGAVTFPPFVLILRGSNNALAKSLWRSLGSAATLAIVGYLALMIIDSEADSAVSSQRVQVLSMRPTFGPLPGSTRLRLADNETITVFGDDLGKAGKTAAVYVHKGRIPGWRWISRKED
ncbi:MAG TPA: hypothetical protein VGO62_06305, partial [Myxococcota bacterium]